MDLAFLIAIAGCVALGVYSLRITADRDRWQDIAEESLNRLSSVNVYGQSFADDSPRKRQERAQAICRELRKPKRRK